ncbi:hypothetical protein [Nocardia brasiliensis]|uniref:hypothetical protein n=1 Tax=Nocardia brasiliensis TaxID=37326 RepID=UPI00245771D6|nr:hypothetical protein [Nocardia brasiliensis]
MIEYGIFSDEGCVEARLYSREEAEQARKDLIAGDWDASELDICEMCSEHDEQRADECQACAEEEIDG